ncbi:DUF1642 domain-containing protein [Bacillus sp. JJ722]|uniref:DUF1642 domain-containing protein n=1 Tax=Bacillus sp. JJ722 TaxID=3122973 RepID=UPI002FFE8256
MSKVILPKEVAEAIERLREGGCSNFEIIRQAHGAVFTETYLTIKRWAFENGGGSSDDLMSALINGYEVEQNPEDRLREFYEECLINASRADGLGRALQREFESGKYLGIKCTLNTLGIKIEGINAK